MVTRAGLITRDQAFSEIKARGAGLGFWTILPEEEKRAGLTPG